MGDRIQNNSLVEILVPKNGRTLIKTSSASLVGHYDTAKVASIQLLEPFRTRKYIQLVTKEQKENFPKEIRKMFSADILLGKIIYRTDRVRRESDSTGYQFHLSDDVDIKKFWGSTQFKEMLAAAYDAKVLASEVTFVGWKKKNVDVLQSEYRQRYGNTFSFSVSLQPGKNSFFIRALASDGNENFLDSVLFFYKTQVQEATFSDGYEHSPFHENGSEKVCASCHSLELSPSVIEQKSGVEAECKTCHSLLVNQKSSHVPANGWDCLMCHDPSSSPKYQLYPEKQYDASLCYECHTEHQEANTTKATVHPPAATGECLLCHDPHGTQHDALLIEEISGLCKACHEDVAVTPHPVVRHPLGGRQDPLNPNKELTCVTCHNPHASENEFLLLAPRLQLCAKCHQK